MQPRNRENLPPSAVGATPAEAGAPASASFSAVYLSAARPWSDDELAAAYRAAVQRADAAPAERLPGHPISPLSSAVPRLVRLSAAVHLLHVLPAPGGSSAAADSEVITRRLLATVDQNAAEALRLCDLALHVADRVDPVEDWVSHALEEAADALPRLSYTAHPPSLNHHVEEAGRCVAIAIDHAYTDPPSAPVAIADALGNLLVICAFAELADRRADDRPADG